MRARALAPCLLLAGACGGPGEPPDVVFITIDTFRADRMAAYGNHNGLTPTMDALAASGTVFETAMTPIGTTHPSHASMFTSLYPGQHGVRFNGDVLDPSLTTLAEIFQGAGYQTAAFISKRTMLAKGFDQGFAVHADEGEEDAEDDSMEALKARTRGSLVNEGLRGWTASRAEGPFFLWLHFFEAHSPYPLNDFAARNLEGYRGPYAEGASVGMFYGFGRTIRPDQPNRRALRVLYDSQVVEIDHLLREALGDLEQHGMLENAIVVLVADHGQLLGEHDQVGHGFKLYEPILHVPLVIREPGQSSPRRVAERVSLVDLLPTLLELTGIDAPRAIVGRSLVPLLRGRALDETAHFASVRVPKIKNEDSRTEDKRAVAVYEGRYKLVYDDDGEELFDLSTDPDELHPLPEGPDTLPTLERLRPLALLHRERERPDQEELDLSPETLEELRDLGYVR